MRIAGAAYTRNPMRIAFGGRPFYAHSRGVEGVAPKEQYQGGIGRRPLSRPSSSFLLLGRPTPGRGRVRSAQKVDGFSDARPRGMGPAGLGVAAPVPVRPGRRRGSVRIEEPLPGRLLVGHTATDHVLLLA